MGDGVLFTADEERRIIEDPRFADRELLLLLAKFDRGDTNPEEIQKYGFVKEVGGPNGKRIDWDFTDPESKRKINSCLQSMGVVFKDNSEEVKWMKHNLYARAQGLKNIQLEKIQPLVFNINASWQDWLKLQQEMLSKLPYFDVPADNQTVKSFFLGYGAVEWKNPFGDQEQPKEVIDYFLNIFNNNRRQHSVKQFAPKVAKIFGPKGLKWLSEEQVTQILPSYLPGTNQTKS